MKELKSTIENFDVISFDVFDTLLLRPYLTQEDLWLDLGRCELGEKDGAVFLKVRIAADKKTYAEATKRGGEHTLEEAYRLMPKQYASQMAKEERLQQGCLMANPEMLEIWKRAGELGKKRIIVSDMYLSEAWFAETLKEKGLGDYDALYVSSARQARKSSGKLFEIVKKDFAGKKVLHIGDNEQSDVKMAEAVGLTGCHYRNLRDETFATCPFLKSYLAEWPSFAKRLQVGALVRGYKLARGAEKGYWWRLGYFFGGVLGHLFVGWLASAARARGVNHLMFVARDGYLWKQMLDLLQTGIKTDYFYAPRMTSVKVCGVVGTDRAAMAEREKILDSLPDNDPDKELARYRGYLNRYDITADTAVVDGCSSAFSVQRLVEAACGRPVPAFYLRAISPLVNGDALYERKSGCRWQGLSEFLFSSPERPIDDVDVNGPRYRDDVFESESFRESVFEEMADGILVGFKVLQAAAQSGQWRFSRQDWLDYFAAFQCNLTEEDEANLSLAKNAWQIRQENFSPVVVKSSHMRTTYRLGIPIGIWHSRATVDGCIERFYLLGRIPTVKRERRGLQVAGKKGLINHR